ncbi:hypothetical protein, partial [Caproicibacter sp.]|uniref:hypothetical protein n=1 Tax=Caproicibacter sp. TaxID=2814884 RepID=UPI0039896E3C
MTINPLSATQIASLIDSKSKPKQGTSSASFAEKLNSASKSNQDTVQLSENQSGQTANITEAGRNSTGTKTLTAAQKQYLREKYHLADSSGLSDSQLNSLLADLTNDGALSYQDYRRAHIRVCALLPSGAVFPLGTPFPSGKTSGNYAGYYQKIIQGEQEGADYIKENYGIDPSADYYDCINAH